MNDSLDAELKAEIEKISDDINAILKKIEDFFPSKTENEKNNVAGCVEKEYDNK
jgi:hypothetical protein